MAEARAGRETDRVAQYRKGWVSVDGAVLVAITWLLVGPRVDVFTVASSSIRLEDLVFLALLGFVTSRGWQRLVGAIGLRMVLATVGVALAGGLSLLAATASGRVDVLAGILYAVRPLEYWIVLPAVILGLRQVQGRRARVELMLGLVTVVQVGVGLLQILGVPIGFSKFTYERAAGMTAGPYELGAICAMLACFWLCRRAYLLAAVSLVGVVVSQSRVSLAAVGIGLLVVLLGNRRQISAVLRAGWRRRRSLMVAGIVIAAVGGSVAVALLGQPVWERIATTSILSAWTDARRFSDAIPPIASAHDYLRVAFDRINLVIEGASIDDVSNVVRFFRWQLLIAAMVVSPLAWFVGLGPSFAGPSVDGAFLRVLVEFGAVGILAWGFWFVQAVRKTGVWMLAVLATLLVGCLAIDLFFALRPMVLFWFLAAIARLESTPTDPVAGGVRP